MNLGWWLRGVVTEENQQGMRRISYQEVSLNCHWIDKVACRQQDGAKNVYSNLIPNTQILYQTSQGTLPPSPPQAPQPKKVHWSVRRKGYFLLNPIREFTYYFIPLILSHFKECFYLVDQFLQHYLNKQNYQLLLNYIVFILRVTKLLKRSLANVFQKILTSL